MKVVTLQESTISVERLVSKLTKREGILLKISKKDPKIRFLKIGKWWSEKKVTRAWVTLEIGKSSDDTFSGMSSEVSDIKDEIKRSIKCGDDDFYWFRNEKECFEFLCENFV